MRPFSLAWACALLLPSLSEAALPPWPLESTVESARAFAAAAPLTRPTGLRRADYLATISSIVNFWTAYQSPNGTIIDPYRHQETQYATPCFAFACATVLPLHPGLLPNCSAALSAATLELATRTCADGHCVFFLKPVMFAYRLLAPQVPPATKAQWDANLQAMDPYRDFGFPVSGNWGLVGTLDMLRTDLIAHFGNSSWWRAELDYQLGGENIPHTFTPNGLYQDHSGMQGLNPLPYDTFPVSGYLTVMLAEGYNGSWAPSITELTRRAAWTHLLMQSPKGEVPTGGRSSQHTWNEAVSALAYEVNAVRYAAAGDAGAACLFQRAAHLSHESVRRWLVPGEGRVQIVKNHFDPSLRWGYEGYSYLSQYNLLPAGMLSAAYHYADAQDAIPECAGFADVGGYAFQLPEHNLVIANAGGLYLQVELAADPHYESGGVSRVHVDTCGAHPPPCAALGALATLSASPPQQQGGVSLGGPWWATASGSSASLGNASYAEVTAVTFTPGWAASADAVSFEVQYVLGSGVVVRQAFALSTGNASAPLATIVASVAQIGSSAGGNFTRFGMQLPVFLFDGASNATVTQAGLLGLTVTAPAAMGGGGTVSLSVLPTGEAATVTPPGPGDLAPTRNGIMGVGMAETAFKTQAPSMTLVMGFESL